MGYKTLVLLQFLVGFAFARIGIYAIAKFCFSWTQSRELEPGAAIDSKWKMRVWTVWVNILRMNIQHFPSI